LLLGDLLDKPSRHTGYSFALATHALSCSIVSATHASSATHAGIGNTRRNFLVVLLWLIYRRGLRLLLIHLLTHFFTDGVAVLFFFSSVGDSRLIGNTCRHRRSNRRFFFLVNSLASIRYTLTDPSLFFCCRCTLTALLLRSNLRIDLRSIHRHEADLPFVDRQTIPSIVPLTEGTHVHFVSIGM